MEEQPQPVSVPQNQQRLAQEVQPQPSQIHQKTESSSEADPFEMQERRNRVNNQNASPQRQQASKQPEPTVIMVQPEPTEIEIKPMGMVSNNAKA